jgi:spermidine dehydrogenase
MKKQDRELGMDRDITRRDFLSGASVAIGASMLPAPASAQDIGAQDMPGYYPPELTGLRGSHPGSFESAHLARDGVSFDGEDTGEHYDLVVVGGGISGLSAAHFYRQSMGDNARILVLDNHDDFGGHAKRNEFQINDQKLICYGGTNYIEAPSDYPDIAKKLIRDLGIETQRFYQYFDQDFYSSLGLSQGLFFDQQTFGANHLAVGDLADSSVLEHSPLSVKARANLVRLFKDEQHYLHDIPDEKRAAYLQNIDYWTYLKDHAGMDDEVLKVMQPSTRSVWAVSIDAFPAHAAWSSGYPGFGDLDRSRLVDAFGDHEEPNIFHFPDGNASVARLLVRKLIPAVAVGDSMEDIVTARFNYNQLDNPKSKVRIRLNSTVVRAQHVDDVLSNPVKVTYVSEGKARVVEAGKVVMACYHSIIPHLCPEMSGSQKTALSNSVRAPLVFTNVLIRNWSSLAKLGVSRIDSPGSFHHSFSLDMPVSIGEYQFSKSPDEPVVLTMRRVPGEPGNKSAREQFNTGKRELLAMPFETFERGTRDQLSRILSPGGFDAARDIAAITVNRWPHGYAYGHDPETDQVAFEYSTWPEEKRHWVTGRRPFGNISIAATDSASTAMTESAIEEAYRAVNDLM